MKLLSYSLFDFLTTLTALKVASCILGGGSGTSGARSRGSQTLMVNFDYVRASGRRCNKPLAVADCTQRFAFVARAYAYRIRSSRAAAFAASRRRSRFARRLARAPTCIAAVCRL